VLITRAVVPPSVLAEPCEPLKDLSISSTHSTTGAMLSAT
jgi:hypothetical protein